MRFIWSALLVTLLPIWICPLGAADFRFDSVGLRAGFSATSMVEGFNQSEIFATADLPLRHELESGWYCQLRVEITAGILDRRGVNAVIGGFGPAAVVGHRDLPVQFTFGCNPTGLSRDTFGNVNFGSHFHFTSYAGLLWDLNDHWRLGFRFQHMSSAGIGTPNPGLNLYSLAFSRRF